MTEFICMLAALCEGFVNFKIVKTAETNYKKEEPKKECEKPFKDTYPNASKFASGYKHPYARDRFAPNTDNDNKPLSVSDWCSLYLEDIIIMQSMDEYLIDNDKLKKVDKEELANVLLEKLSNVQSIDITKDGLMIKTKGGI